MPFVPPARTAPIAFAALLLAAGSVLAQAVESPPADAAEGEDPPPQTAPAETRPKRVHPSKSGQTPQELANTVANPAAPVTVLQLREILLPSVEATSGVTSALQVQPVLPIGPFPWLPVVQLMKITVPVFLSYPKPIDRSGVGDLQLFDLVTIKEPWGTWGVGVTFSFPTASHAALGTGKWEAGPAVAILYTGIHNLTAGFVLQNPIAFTGDPNRKNVNQMVLSPTLTYTFRGGWFAGLTDFNWAFDWTSDGAASIPLGAQAGKVIHFGKQPVSFSIEAGRAVARPANTPNPGWIVGIEITPIFQLVLR
jgi:hypothetical protein